MLQKTHSIAGLLAAQGAVIYFDQPWLTWEAMTALAAGCLAGPLADIDKPGAVMNKVLFPFAYLLRATNVKHRTMTHSIAFIALLFVLLNALPPVIFWAVLLAYATHPLLDLFNSQGVALLWPLKWKIRLLPRFLCIETGGYREAMIRLLLMLVIIVLPFKDYLGLK